MEDLEVVGGLGKLICIKKCDYCGCDVEIRHKKRLERKNIFCSKSCEANFRKAEKETVCPICGKNFHIKKSHKDKCKNNFCSRECFAIHKSEYMKGEGNHQYGLTGDLNASWKSNEKISIYGYKLIRCLNHPFANCDGFVFEHRLVAEEFLLTENNSIIIDGKAYLAEGYVVHHKDFNKLNNDIDNLEIMTRGDHMALHHKLRNKSIS